MSQAFDTINLDELNLSSGAGANLEVELRLDPFSIGSERYSVESQPLIGLLDISRMSNGYALHLQFSAPIAGRCVRCLNPAQLELNVDAREVSQPGGGEELESPYVTADDELDLKSWAHDALILGLPAQIYCRADCKGLCAECGVDLNDHPDHHHAPPIDPRLRKLSEALSQFQATTDDQEESS